MNNYKGVVWDATWATTIQVVWVTLLTPTRSELKVLIEICEQNLQKNTAYMLNVIREVI